MTTYSCEQGCGMSVKGFTCGSCGKELVHETLTKDEVALWELLNVQMDVEKSNPPCVAVMTWHILKKKLKS